MTADAYYNLVNFDDLLNKTDLTLEDMFEDEEILEEFKYVNPKIVDLFNLSKVFIKIKHKLKNYYLL